MLTLKQLLKIDRYLEKHHLAPLLTDETKRYAFLPKSQKVMVYD